MQTCESLRSEKRGSNSRLKASRRSLQKRAKKRHCPNDDDGLPFLDPKLNLSPFSSPPCAQNKPPNNQASRAPTATAAASTSGRDRETVSDLPRQGGTRARARARGRAAASAGEEGKGGNTTTSPSPLFSSAAAAAATAAALSLCLAVAPLAAPVLPVARAEIETLSASEALSAARPLPKQAAAAAQASESRVWAVFAVGAAGVFGGAVAAERLEALFPAIATANKAAAASRKAAEEAEQREAASAAVEVASARGMADGSLADAVSEGIAEASRKAREQLKEGKSNK